MKVGILIGSDSDFPIMKPAVEFLKSFGIEFELRVASAHRTPNRVREFVANGEKSGIRAFIVGAGAAAHLAGVVASYTTLPVVAVPINATPLNGLDALLSTVQMPSGVPVATMAVNGAKNSAIFVAEILALSDESLAKKLKDYREDMADKVNEKNLRVQSQL
ncbi:MAG: 5-(carboxyamino)imidazole ribonucleotide mutase [Selenomonadaceae bacterium]|nr:5-(carboxyamino)imidazole ribonucleotide mutase [Selenomonadaceae bacterium]